MATPAKPLTASIAERLGLPKPEPEKRPAPRLGPPPSSPPPPKLHQLPPPAGPDRSLVEASDMGAAKKKQTRKQYTDKFKAEVVARFFASQEGKEKISMLALAKEYGVHSSNISNWVKQGEKEREKLKRSEAIRLGKARAKGAAPTLASNGPPSKPPSSAGPLPAGLDGLGEWLRTVIRTEVRVAMKEMLGGQ